MSGRTYIFAGGGTGGHLFPGIAVAERLVATEPEARILFLGTDRPVERDILATTCCEHQPLPKLPELRRNPFGFVERFWAAYSASLRELRNRKPAAVVGCGGGASVAPVVAARRLGIPVFLLEQNVISGRATRLLARLETTVCLTYAESELRHAASAWTVVTGNPVRQAIADLATSDRTKAVEKQTRTLLVLGGSQGAHSVNDAVLDMAQQHRTSLTGWRVVHQTGRQDTARVREAYANLGIYAVVEPFFDDIVTYYRDSDLVVSRAGGTTLSELACAGLPAVLVPYPHATDDHQTANANVFANAGAAVVVNWTFTDDWQTTLAREICQLLGDNARRETMAQVMRSLARSHAAEEVAALIRDRS